MSYNSELSANNAELREILAGVQALPSAGGGIPAGMGIKYIIPCRLTMPRTADGLGFDAITLTISRENTNQLMFADWRLIDPMDFATVGFWTQHIAWVMCEISNYQSQHMVSQHMFSYGIKGTSSGDVKVANYPKTALSHTITWQKVVGADENYIRHGEHYKGLLFITDSTYHGAPIVDASKLTDFITCDYVQAGW